MAAVIWLCQTLMHLRTVRYMKLPAWHAALMPASAGLYCAIASYSAWQHHYGGGNVWKGRQYGRAMLRDAVEVKPEARNSDE